jgi:ADP-heptose:LPS heptosyltransferase
VNVLIAKLGATGDVVRTTTLVARFPEHVSWITEAKNAALLRGLGDNLRCLTWEERDAAGDRTYDVIINLEDTLEVGLFLKTLQFRQLFGAYVDSTKRLRYTDDSRRWFDLSLISRYGRKRADRLKFQNRRTYQELIFDGLGFRFGGEKYMLPQPLETGLSGDVAIADEAGPVWPMKKWAHYDQLKHELEMKGLKVNVLPRRKSLLEHLADVRGHRCLVGGDSLPMHMALGTMTPCVSLFTCTSPWEIYDYGIQTKIISRLLGEFFYQRGFDPRAASAISVEDVFDAVMNQLDGYLAPEMRCLS